ncbi:MAG TPA: phosphatidate cytidylyltransferase [Pseudonocardiaceae bacterium]
MESRAPAAAAERTSRAGRNLPAAVAVGLTLGGGILLALFTARHVFVGIVAAALAVGTWEFAGALRRGGGITVPVPVLLAGGQAMLWLSWPYGLDGAFVALAVTGLACLVWRFRGGANGYVRDVTAALFVLCYLPLLACFAVALVLPQDGAFRVLAFMVTVVCSDIGGYVAGVLFGRHAMAPTISPKKSWEGFGGSVLLGVAGATAVVVLGLDAPAWIGLLLGGAVVLTATVGDLAESLMKRDLGIKDMGTTLPGHGGLMDRLDSLLPSALVTWCLLTALV